MPRKPKTTEAKKVSKTRNKSVTAEHFIAAMEANTERVEQKDNFTYLFVNYDGMVALLRSDAFGYPNVKRNSVVQRVGKFAKRMKNVKIRSANRKSNVGDIDDALNGMLARLKDKHN